MEKFLEHERSDMHKEAVLKQVAHNSNTNVSAQLSTQCKEAQNLHQRMLLKLISSIQFLASQGMPLRGCHEDLASLDSNLYKLLLLRAEDCPEMKTWIYRKEYTSPEIVNEILALMGNTVLRSIVSDIHSSSWFSIIADEATDISRNEQMSLSIRWTNEYVYL